MKTILLIVLLLVTSLLYAQEPANEPGGPDPNAARELEGQTPPSDVPAASDQSQSVRPGHPLDPHDVDVLTGKLDREAQAQRYGRGQVYLGDTSSYGFMRYGYGGRNTQTFRPFLFGAQPFFFHSGFFFPRPRSRGFFGRVH